MLNPETKIMTLEQALAWRAELQKKGVPLVATNGCFDILHRGHAEYLARARSLGGALLLAVNDDATIRAIKGPARPVNPEDDRAYVLAALEAVDAVVVFKTQTATPLLEAVRPDIYAKGGDYTIDTIVQEERRALEAFGCRIVILPVVPGRSTTNTIKRINQAPG